MNKRKVSEEEQAILINKLEQKWDIEMGKLYWYPLYKYKREDVVAFNELDFEVKRDEMKVQIIIDSILELGDLKVFDMNEFEKSIYEINTASLEPFYSADGNGEKIWFSEKMNWVKTSVKSLNPNTDLIWSDNEDEYKLLQSKLKAQEKLVAFRKIQEELIKGVIHSILFMINGGNELADNYLLDLVDRETKESLLNNIALHEEFYGYLLDCEE